MSGSQHGMQMTSPNGLPGSGNWSPELRKAQVYEQILLDVILGRLAPGARLDEQALARQYGAGLAGVRDALGRLSLEGLIVRRARSGTTVTQLDLVDLRQGYEARALIEPHCAALAATNASKEQLGDILSAFDGGESAALTMDCEALVAMDQRFHAAIAYASGNAALARVLIPLQHKAARFWVYSMHSATAEDRIEDIALHRMVASRIAARDVEGARAAMVTVLGVLPDNVRRIVAQTDAAPV